jgi:acid phosphatase family membrane protein YuiD
MDFLLELGRLVTNDVLLVPAFAWFTAQMLKVLINGIVNKTFSAERLVGDGGMPSGHSATVMSLAMMCGHNAGFGSVEFGLAMIFAIVVMHDALGVRRETGKQAVSIIEMAELLNEFFSEKDEKIKTDKLKVLVGHTPLQVVCGALLGFIVFALYAFLLEPIVFHPLFENVRVAIGSAA